jgi:hypothetical protein
MKKLNLLLLFLSFSIYSIAQKKGQSGAYYDYSVRCQGVEMDGTLTLESYGKGRNYWDAAEQAKKNAVYVVVFKGVKDGNGGCNSDPLLISASADIIHEEYFANFFIDGGAYTDFVSMRDERAGSKIKRNAKKSKEMQQRMVVVRVNRLALKKKLELDKIK